MADRFNFLNFTVFDFETTGLDYMKDQVIEACVIRVRDGAPTMMFNTLVQLREGMELTKQITDITGHTITDLDGGITEEKLAGILSWMVPDDELLVAYNAAFDLSFLNALFERHDYTTITCDFLDPLTITRDRMSYPHKLSDVCKRMGIPFEHAHTAEADTMALMDLVFELHKQKDVSEYVNVLGYNVKYGEPSWYPEHATLKAQGKATVNHTSKSPLVPKSSGAIVTKNKRKKLVPDDPKQFDQEHMPSGLLRKSIKDKIDTWLESAEVILELCVDVEDEFDATMAYLTKVCNIDEASIESTLDNPAEAIIIVDALPF